MLRGAALLAFAQLATAFREVSDPSRPCSERAGCQACLSRDAHPGRCQPYGGLALGLDVMSDFVQCDDAAYLAQVASAAPARQCRPRS